jgi:hypothetical protein
MPHLTSLIGVGQLFTQQAGATGVRYRVAISQCVGNSGQEQISMEGELEATPLAIAAAQAEGAAVLVLEDGQSIDIRLGDCIGDGFASFIVVGSVMF